MSTLASPNIKELVANIELIGIKFLHISAKAKEDVVEEESTADVGIEIQESHSEDHLEVRFRVQVDHSEAEYKVELATRYLTKVSYDLNQALLREFIERVAIMAVFPYIREAVSSMAARLELEVPILGMLRQGEFKLGDASTETEDTNTSPV